MNACASLRDISILFEPQQHKCFSIQQKVIEIKCDFRFLPWQYAEIGGELFRILKKNKTTENTCVDAKNIKSFSVFFVPSCKA